MRSELAVWIALMGILAACGDLDTELPPDQEDQLAGYVERGGIYDRLPPAPRKDVDTEGLSALNHTAWGAIAGAYVQDGLVDYDGFWAAQDSREVLEGYLDLLAALDPEQLESDDERLAFWINAYNALVFYAAAQTRAQRPAFSPMDDGFALFNVRRHQVAGTVFSLDAIEHGVIRGDKTHPSYTTLNTSEQAIINKAHSGVTADARIHVALNCGAVSCPLLPSRAFHASDLDAHLTERAALFVQDPARGAGQQGISSLFSWFEQDFIDSFGSPRNFIELHRQDISDVNFEQTLPYDWTLNAR